jgi:GNAT superfamily N-acetyltransferase
MPITYREIVVSGVEYEQEKDLRNRVLRRPLGMELSAADTRGEEKQIHFAAFAEGGGLIGCVLLKPEGGGSVRLRQMAIDPRHQSRGVGRELVRRAEEAARAAGYRRITLHARLSARGFYEKGGYRAVSDVFEEVTLPHVTMEKILIPA